MSEYTRSYYKDIAEGSARSAAAIVPIILGLLPLTSVVDIGCGEGAWLSAFHERGVADEIGVDGEHVNVADLKIPVENFRVADLSLPFSLGRTFDLAVSLEVGEHLPRESAPSFVESLTNLAPAVLFSAAIPFQGGNHHVNEQWPESWATLFEVHGFVPIDCVRPRVWDNPSVEWWYAQNTLLYVRKEMLENNKTLKIEYERSNPAQFRLIHPGKYLHLYGLYEELLTQKDAVPGLKATSRAFWLSLTKALVWRLRWAHFDRASHDGEPKCLPPSS